MKIENLFVYGTLAKFKHNNMFLVDQKFVGYCYTQNKYSLYYNNLPYIKELPETSKIYGCLYEITSQKLKELDIFEGHPLFYERKIINIIYNNNILECYTYFGKNLTKGVLIENGDYINYNI